MKIYRKIRIRLSGFPAKLLLAFLTATILPLAVITGISYHVSYSIARDKILSSALMSDEQLTSQFNIRLSQTENVADTIRYLLYSLQHSSVEQQLDELNIVRNNVSLYKSTFDFSHIFLFLPENMTGAEEGIYFFPMETFSEFHIEPEDFRTLGVDSLWKLQEKLPLPQVLTGESWHPDTLLCWRGLHNQNTDSLEYAYCIAIDTEEFSRKIHDSFGTEEISSYLLTPEGQIAAHSRDALNNTFQNEKILKLLQEHADSFFSFQNCYYNVQTLVNGWLHVTEIPETYIKSNIRILIQSLLLSSAVFLPLTVLVILLFSRRLTRRITLLSHAMESFRLKHNPEHFAIIAVPHPDNPDEYDEIDQLGLTFEDMQHTLYRNLKSIVELSVSEERLKYQLLQSQINPHFLYNILGSIRTCQTLGKLDIAEQMITELTSFYRLTLRKSKELIPIRDELEIARLYLDMEKLCHPDNLQWTIMAEDGIENFLICKFTLQPFLENSILHGLSASVDRLIISIQAEYGDDTVIIKITDNGSGIEPQVLEQLRYSMENKIINYEKHFGISNVNARIANPLYGKGHISIESIQGEGTCITIEFEQMEEEETV